jgi:hypothetical protein
MGRKSKVISIIESLSELNRSYYMDEYNKLKEYGENNKLYQPQNMIIDFIENDIKGDLVSRYIKYRSLGNGVTCDKMILRYGKINGQIKWDEYIKIQSKTNTFEYKQKKYGWTHKQFDDYNQSRSQTKGNMIKRHGKEIGDKKWAAYIERQKDAGCSLKYFIELYGKDDGTNKYLEVNKQKAHTLDNFIRKYGKNLGRVRYETFMASKIPPLSKPSQELFWKLSDEISPHYKDHIYFGEHNREYGKFDIENKSYYYYDFVMSDIKIVIEYHGDIYHGNPSRYNADDIPPFRGNKQTAQMLWKKDKRKKEVIESHGFKYIHIWDSEYQ